MIYDDKLPLLEIPVDRVYVPWRTEDVAYGDAIQDFMALSCVFGTSITCKMIPWRPEPKPEYCGWCMTKHIGSLCP